MTGQRSWVVVLAPQGETGRMAGGTGRTDTAIQGRSAQGLRGRGAWLLNPIRWVWLGGGVWGFVLWHKHNKGVLCCCVSLIAFGCAHMLSCACLCVDSVSVSCQ